MSQEYLDLHIMTKKYVHLKFKIYWIPCLLNWQPYAENLGIKGGKSYNFFKILDTSLHVFRTLLVKDLVFLLSEKINISDVLMFCICNCPRQS